jgi:tripartite-type tricarboxylate transporter receptor subunit TctC
MRIRGKDCRRYPAFCAVLCGALSGSLLVAASEARAAEGYPNKPIRIVCHSPPGGGADFVSRTLGEKLAERLGQPVVVDNRPGASGSIGAGIVAKSAPDGYTVLLGSSSAVAVNPALQRLSYQAVIKDFAPVTLVSRVSYVLVVHPAVPATSVAELIRLAKSQPGRLNYASSGTGSASHLAMELFKNMAGVDLTHIPYKGSAPAVIDLIGGQVQTGFNNLIPALPHVKSGRLRALGVSGSARSAAMPEVPTIAESGLPGYEALQWYGVLLPARAPRVIIDRLNQEIGAILQLPEVRERLTHEGGDVIGGTPEQFAAHIEREIAKWTKVVNAANIRAN